MQFKSNDSYFDFDYYKFYDQRRVFDHKEYLETFLKNEKVHKEKIRKQLMELVYVQTLTRVHNEFPVITQIQYYVLLGTASDVSGE